MDETNRNLAVSCANGLLLLGTEQAEADGVALLEKAADAGSPQARFILFVKNYEKKMAVSAQIVRGISLTDNEWRMEMKQAM